MKTSIVPCLDCLTAADTGTTRLQSRLQYIRMTNQAAMGRIGPPHVLWQSFSDLPQGKGTLLTMKPIPKQIAFGFGQVKASEARLPESDHFEL